MKSTSGENGGKEFQNGVNKVDLIADMQKLLFLVVKMTFFRNLNASSPLPVMKQYGLIRSR